MSRGYIGNLLQAEDPLTSSGVLDVNERYVQLVTPKTQSVATRNILNGVLNCAWNRTSATPKLLEIANGNQVKLNIDSDNPLVLAFANGWDDKDRPAQVIKTLRTAPANIDLSAKANCKVQIVAKVVNDELVITTHDIFDPNVGYGVNICPDFCSDYVDVPPFTVASLYVSTKDGWSVWCENPEDSNMSTSRPRMAFSSAPGNYPFGFGTTGRVVFQSPFPILIAKVTESVTVASGNGSYKLDAWDFDTNAWINIVPYTTFGGTSAQNITLIPSVQVISSRFRYSLGNSYATFNGGAGSIKVYEAPTAKFFRSLNKVKDRSDTEVYWINLGYAMMDASGNITALYHYTDLRNNYPGGMRVEP